MTARTRRVPRPFGLPALLLLAAAFTPGLQAASLQNTDSQAYTLMITEPNRPYSTSYQLLENSQVDICFLGCTMTLLATRQTVEVGPQDMVVIDGGAMTVTRP